jgi:hypothetical protein
MKNDSESRRILSSVVLVVLAIQFIFGIVTVISEQKTESKRFANLQDGISTELLQTVAVPLYNYNKDVISNIFDTKIKINREVKKLYWAHKGQCFRLSLYRF